MAKKKVTETVAEILEPFLQAEGYELYHSEFLKEGGDWFLRVYIDLKHEPFDDGDSLENVGATVCEEGRKEDAQPAYIGTEDCEKVSRFLSEKLDEADPVQQNYYLEVSSPGMDRPLITRRHYDLALGKAIEVRLYKGKDGRKNFAGILREVDDEGIIIREEDEKETRLEMTEIAKAKMAVIL